MYPARKTGWQELEAAGLTAGREVGGAKGQCSLYKHQGMTDRQTMRSSEQLKVRSSSRDKGTRDKGIISRYQMGQGPMITRP